MSSRNEAAGFSDDLDEWLKTAVTANNESTERYVVDRVLRETPEEITQVVYRRLCTNECVGPFVRKRFAEDTGRGQAYERIFCAQTSGMRLEHQPLLYECERVDSSVNVIMEYLHGKTLRTLTLDEGPGVELAKRVIPQLCDALTELHESFEQPLIHRDVKPSNIMLCGKDLKLIDLGIARTYHEDVAHDTVRYGTPGYAPPEQFGYGQTSTRSDVYAAGMTLAFCLTAEDPSPEFRERLLGDPRVPRQLVPVLSRATEFDPERRYASARELKEDFMRALNVGHQVPQRFTLLGRAWNALLITVWAFIVYLCIATAIRYPDQLVGQYPLWFAPIICLTFVFALVTSAIYLLLDKRRLRQYMPFGKHPRRAGALLCLAIALTCMVLVILLSAVVRH